MVKKPIAAIDVAYAVAQGCRTAYSDGKRAQGKYAQALNAAISIAASNGCTNELFETINRAIILGGQPTEVVVGRALAAGSAQGAGEVIVSATATIMCRGGEYASACARAWVEAIRLNSKGCLVLVKAFAQAKAECGPGYATSQVQAATFTEPLGTCRAPGLGPAGPIRLPVYKQLEGRTAADGK
jgi:hypothetical protein